MIRPHANAVLTWVLLLTWPSHSNRKDFWMKLITPLFRKCFYNQKLETMDAKALGALISAPEMRKPFSAIQVLQVNDASFVGDYEDSLQDGIYVCHAPLMRAIEQIW